MVRPQRANLPAPKLRARCAAFSLMELLVVIAILAVLIAITLPLLAKAQAAQRSVNCRSNLHHIAVAFTMYAHENHGRLPDPSTANLSWEQMLLRYYHGAFQCPSDPELYTTVGSSYDWRDTGDPTTTLAGRLLTDVRRSETVLAFDALSGWHAKHQTNIVRIDGSSHTVKDEECAADLQLSVNSSATSQDAGTAGIKRNRRSR